MEPYANALAAAVEESLGGWVERSVTDLMKAWSGSVPEEVGRAAAAAGERACREVGPQVRSLLSADIDKQMTTPLALMRRAVMYPTAILRQAGVPEVQRDEFAVRSFPEDVYALVPANWADIDPSLAEPGLAWSAAKAYEHMRRHRK